MQKRVTLSLNSKTYEHFQEYCKEHDIIVSKRIDRLMEEMLNDKRGVKKDE